MRVFAIVSVLALLSGCTSTYSFAPPAVNVSKLASQSGKGGCTFTDSDTDISAATMDNARKLVDNFILSYRCAVGELADGRRDFEIPALLSTVGGAAAAALGAGTNVAIATGTTGALYTSGKSYFDPKAKAHIVSGGVDALLCIKMASSGVTAYEIGRFQEVISTKAQSFKAAGARIPSEIEFSPEQQYYEMVATALMSVENVMLQRLSSVGQYSPDAIITEIKALDKKTEDAGSDSAKTNATNQVKALTDDTAKQAAVADTIVKLAELRPILQSCVIRAKT